MGFYWTLPLPQVGFTDLPKSVEEAAAGSRTIRYQRERVRRHVAAKGGQLVHEAVWIELGPGRGSRHVEAEFHEAVDSCRRTEAQLLYVDFAERHGWRPHRQLKTFLDGLANRPMHRPLEPDSITIHGRRFDPVAHFRRRRREMAERGTPAERRQELLGRVLARAAGHLPPAVPRADYAALAEALNRDGIRTTTGRRWAPDTLRLFVRDVLKPQRVSALALRTEAEQRPGQAERGPAAAARSALAPATGRAAAAARVRRPGGTMGCA